MESDYVLGGNGEPAKTEKNTWQKPALPDGSAIGIAYLDFFVAKEKILKFEYTPVVTENLPMATTVQNIQGKCKRTVIYFRFFIKKDDSLLLL